MKKMILALVVALVAGLSQAASLNWTITNVKSSSDSTAAGGSYIAYLFFTEVSSSLAETYSVTTVDAVKTAIAGGTTTFDTTTAPKAYATGTTSSSGGITGATGLSGFDSGDSVTGFAVVFDADKKNYIVTDVKSASWTSSTGAKSLAFGSQANNTTFIPASVPEPCSVALVLMGVAVLGLKRRVA